jgi:hypothetical protein
MDRHERIVPDIMQWEIRDCDINKDLVVGDWLQVTSTKVQVKHLDHLFRAYIKSMGKDTVCRVEESVSCPKGPSAIEAINNIFNRSDRIEGMIADLERKLDKTIFSMNEGYHRRTKKK